MHLYLIMFHPASVLHQFHHVSLISCWHILTDSKTAWVFQPIVFFFPGSHVQTPGSIVELVEHQRLDPLVVSGAAMQLRFPENWFKTSPCYGVMDQWYMFLIYVPFVMVIPVYGYDNHDICYDIICFFGDTEQAPGSKMMDWTTTQNRGMMLTNQLRKA